MATNELLLRLHPRAIPRQWLRLRFLVLSPALVVFALYIAFYVQFAARLALFPFGLDQGEGYDAWSAWLVAQGRLPYSYNGAFPYFSINYPPLWSALVSIPLAFTGPSLAPARMLSALVTLLDAALVAGAAWRLTAASRFGSPRLAAFLAGAFFLASPYVFHTTSLSRLNSTLTLFTLLALTFAERPTQRRVALLVLCVLAVGFTKPTGLVTALACIVWVMATQPRLGLAAAGLVAAASAALLVVLNTVTGGAFWLNVVIANRGPFDLGSAGGYFVNFASLHTVVLAFALTECWRRFRGHQWSPWMVALGASLMEASLVGHWGAGESYFLNAVAVTSVLAGAAIARIVASFADPPIFAPRRDAGPEIHPRVKAAILRLGDPLLLLALVLFAQALVMAHGPLSQTLRFLPDRGLQAWILGREPSPGDRESGEEIVDLMRASQGPVLSEEPSFPLVAGKEVVANASHLRDLDDKGLWDSDPMVKDIEGRRFGLILLNAQRYPPRVLTAIGRSYYVVRAVPMGAASYLVFLPGG